MNGLSRPKQFIPAPISLLLHLTHMGLNTVLVFCIVCKIFYEPHQHRVEHFPVGIVYFPFGEVEVNIHINKFNTMFEVM